MTCQQAWRLLEDQRDAGSSIPLPAAFVVHMTDCGACGERWAITRRLEAALREIRAEMEVAPSPRIERNLLEAFRSTHLQPVAVLPSIPTAHTWLLRAAVVLIAAGAGLAWYVGQRLTHTPPVSVTAAAPQPVHTGSAAAPGAASRQKNRVARRLEARRPTGRNPAAPAPDVEASIVAHISEPGSVESPRAAADAPALNDEMAAGFLPLAFGAAALEGDSHVVQVEVPRSALFDFGVSTQPGRDDDVVKADVLVGDDGMPRGIRFVDRTPRPLSLDQRSRPPELLEPRSPRP
jgi:hypothetical protein